MSKCINFKMIVFDSDNRRMSRIRCKSWACQYCSNINRRYWRKFIFNFLDENPNIQWSFHTFTLPSKYRKMSLSDCWQFIRNSWQKLIQSLTRLYGKFEYVRVIELHRDGTPHIHLLAGFSVPVDDLSKSKSADRQYIKKLKHSYVVDTKTGPRRYKSILSRLGYGYITNSQNARNGARQSTAYITKYLTKMDSDIESLVSRAKVRIVSVSRGFKPKRAKIDGSWRVLKHLNYADYAYHKQILDLNLDKVTTVEDLDEHHHYPHDDEYLE